MVSTLICSYEQAMQAAARLKLGSSMQAPPTLVRREDGTGNSVVRLKSRMEGFGGGARKKRQRSAAPNWHAAAPDSDSDAENVAANPASSSQGDAQRAPTLQPLRPTKPKDGVARLREEAAQELAARKDKEEQRQQKRQRMDALTRQAARQGLQRIVAALKENEAPVREPAPAHTATAPRPSAAPQQPQPVALLDTWQAVLLQQQQQALLLQHLVAAQAVQQQQRQRAQVAVASAAPPGAQPPGAPAGSPPAPTQP